MNKKEYIDAGIKCAGSFLEHNQARKVAFYVDHDNEDYLRRKLAKWQLGEISRVEVLTSKNSWQRHKLEIILKNMSSTDLFCDADLYWNGPVDVSMAPLCFVREYVLRENETYGQLLEILGLDNNSYAMVNTSVVALGTFAKNETLQKEVFEIFTKIQEICEDFAISLDQREKIKRLSEQLALSIAFTHVIAGELRFLKDIDSPMDGGVAESFYLGTTRGWN